MQADVVILHWESGSKNRLRDCMNYATYAHEHVIPVVVHEYVQASIEYPVVFVKNAETGYFQSVILTGLKPRENLFVVEGDWRSEYIPQVIRNQPLKLVPNQHNHDQLMLAVDQNSDLYGTEEGELLFDETGKETPYLLQRKQQLINYFEQNQITEGFIKLLLGLELLIQQSLSVDISGEKITLQGLYIIDEKKLDTLSDEKFLDLRKRGFLQVIYAHLSSLNQINRLAGRKAALVGREGNQSG